MVWRDLVDNVSAGIAFFPPKPPTYAVKEHQDGTGELYIQPLMQGMQRVTSNCKVMKLKTRKTKAGGWGGGEEIVCAYVQHPDQKTTGKGRRHQTLLYSHGNAVDLGHMLPVYSELSRLLKVNVMGYDYTGYGGSTGEPRMSKTFSDISAVYNCLTGHYKVSPMDIILYGQSVGTGPSAWLGAHQRGLGGVVLHSPLLSGVRVLSPGIKWWPAFADVYTNHLFVPKIEAPVLIMHGTRDDVIDVSSGKRLAGLIKPKYKFPPLFAEGYNHSNVEQCPKYLPHLQAFLAHCAARNLAAADAKEGSPGPLSANANGSNSNY